MVISISVSNLIFNFLLSGVTFTNRQIKMNERIHIKIIDMDETGQWLGSLAVGNERES